MTKPIIVTRAGKGSALTWIEGDANFTNLQNATITVSDGTNSKALDLNSTLTFTAGSNITLSVDTGTGAVTINSAAGGLTDIVNDTSPQLGANLDVNGFSITSASNGNIAIVPNGSGNILLTPSTGNITLGTCIWPAGTGTANQVLTTDGFGNLSFQPPSATVLKDLVMNQTGVLIPKGSVVYITGANGDNPLISFAQANAESTSSKTLGFTTTALTQGSIGYVITNGLLEGIDTNSATIGDPVWLSPTTPGGMVFGLANKPVAPNHIVYLGVVVRVNQNNGAISVKVQNGYELNELHNVSNATPSNNDVLTYISSTGLWTPSASSGGGITDIVNDTTPQLGGNLDLNGFKLTQTSGNLWIEGLLNNDIELFGFGTGNIKLSPAVGGYVYVNGQRFPKGSVTSGQVLTTDGAGTLSWTTPAAGGGTSGLETNFLLMGA